MWMTGCCGRQSLCSLKVNTGFSTAMFTGHSCDYWCSRCQSFLKNFWEPGGHAERHASDQRLERCRIRVVSSLT